MNRKTSALESAYIIDGVRTDTTPAVMLDAAKCSGRYGCSPEEGGQADRNIREEEEYAPIVDESIDPSPADCLFSPGQINDYLDKTLRHRGIRTVQAAYSAASTRRQIAVSLIDTLWRDGHFALEDLALDLRWQWNPAPVGNMAAFYFSVEAACDYIERLGVNVAGYHFSEHGVNRLRIGVGFSGENAQGDKEGTLPAEEESMEQEIGFKETGAGFTEAETGFAETGQAFRETGDAFAETGAGFTETAGVTAENVTAAVSDGKRKCPAHAGGDDSDWIIYIPFDTCGFRLGGSLLAEMEGRNGGPAPEIMDPDYFMDCFEVVRELVEDGVVMSGITVGDGGLMTALGKMFGKAGAGAKKTAGYGITADLSGILKSYGESDSVKVLFGEVPGAIIEIKDSDYDYIDAEFLLQDIAYYPLGHPEKGTKGLKTTTTGTFGISGILQSLLEVQAPEGED